KEPQQRRYFTRRFYIRCTTILNMVRICTDLFEHTFYEVKQDNEQNYSAPCFEPLLEQTMLYCQ
ncbi:MAG: hypothetical protein ACJ71I_03070, partial [Nitrososphaeraceae archaeon]